MIESLAQDIRFAMRELRGAPLFSGIAGLTLALGIGATTALFSTVNATLLRPLPYTHPHQLVDVHTLLVDGRPTTGLLSFPEIDALNRARPVARAAGVAGLVFDTSLISDGGKAIPIVARGVTAGFFDTLSLPMTLGRPFVDDEHAASGPVGDAVVISHRLWTAMFGSSPDVVGRVVKFAQLPANSTIIGVASADLDFPRGTDAWLNLRAPRTVSSPSSHGLSAIVRLRPGASLADLETAGAVAMAEVARTDQGSVGRAFVFRSLLAATVGDLRPTLLIAFGATALLLVLACINVANLTLARGIARTHDVALRSALGASRGRLIRQLLTQSMVLSAVGGLAGSGLAYIAVRAFAAAGGADLPRLETVPLDWRVAVFVMGTAALAGGICGLAPAVRLARTDVRTLLTEGSQRHTVSGTASRLMSGMVIIEVAVAIALVAGGGWLLQSYGRLRSVDLGFATDGRIVIDVRSIHPAKTVEQAEAWLNEVLRRVEAVGEGKAVGAAWNYPFRPDRGGTTNVEVADATPPAQAQSSHMMVVSRGFVEAMGIRLIAGRTFTVDDRRSTEPVVVVNRSFVRKFLAGRDPLLATVALGFPKVNWEKPARIVGVIDDVRYVAPSVAPEPILFAPNTQLGYPTVQQTVVVAAPQADLSALVERIRAELLRYDPQLILAFTSASEVVDASTKYERIGMSLMSAFGIVALVLAAIGVYGVIAYVSSTRRAELATRIALGATRAQVFRLMLSAARRVALIGGLCGLALAYVGGRVLTNSVFGISAADPRVLLSAAFLVGAIVSIATLIPAARASREDPVRVLRAE